MVRSHPGSPALAAKRLTENHKTGFHVRWCYSTATTVGIHRQTPQARLWGARLPPKITESGGWIMKKFIACVPIAFALLSSPTIAADLPKGPVYKATPGPVFSWTGFYGGVNAGYGWDPNYVFENPPGVFDELIPLNLQGPFGGVQFGYNWHYAPRWLIGIEADFQAANITDTFNFNYPGGGASFATLTIRQFGTVRGRFAYVMDRNLFYVTGGLAFAEFRARVLADFDTGDGIINGDKWLAGYVVGFGFERAFGNNWSLKFEYLFIDFEHLDIRGIHTVAGQVALTGDPYAHLVRLGLNMRFATGRP
jgi:outer membrane immunogenic protein